MKRVLYEYLPGGLLLLIFGLIVVHAPLSVWLGTVFPGYDLLIKSWKELLILLVAVLLLVQLIVRKRTALLKDYFILLVFVYSLLHVILIGVYPPANANVAVAGLMIDLRYVMYAALVYTYLHLYPEYRRLFIRVGIAGACIVIGFAVLQLFLPKDILTHIGYGDSTIQPYLTVDKNPNYIRYNSTLRGPNPLGAYAVIALAGAVAWLLGRTRRYRKTAGIFAVLSLVALWISYSRAAYVGAVVAVLLLAYAAYGYVMTRRVWFVIAALVVVLGGGLFAIRNTTFFQNVVLHNNPTTGASIDSNTAHVDSLSAAVSSVATHPLGDGIGSTGSASLLGPNADVVENQYLMVAHEAGWMGLGLFLSLIAYIYYQLFRAPWNWLTLTVLTSGIGLLAIGLLLPVWADDTVSIVWWGLAAIALTGGGYERTTNKKAA